MKSPAEQNFYELLDVASDASAEEIDAAFEKVSAVYEPDSLVSYSLLGSDDARQMLELARQAHATLSDPELRRRYDEERRLGAWGFDAPLQPVVASEEPTPRVQEAPSEFEAARDPDVDLEFAISGLAERLPEAWLGGARPALSAEPRPAPAPVIPPPPQWSPSRVQPPAPVELPPRPAAYFAPPPPVKMPELGVSDPVTGEWLRRVREARGLTLKELADKTRIGTLHLGNLEADRYEALPAKVYVRGFLTILARELQLDPERVSKSYLDLAFATRLSGARERGG